MRKDQEYLLIEFEDDAALMMEKAAENTALLMARITENHSLEDVISISRILLNENHIEDVTEEYGEYIAEHYFDIGIHDARSEEIDWLASNTSLSTNCKLERAA